MPKKSLSTAERDSSLEHPFYPCNQKREQGPSTLNPQPSTRAVWLFLGGHVDARYGYPILGKGSPFDTISSCGTINFRFPCSFSIFPPGMLF